MKNLILILLLGIFSPSFSQTSFSVPTKNARWTYKNYDGTPGIPPWTSNTGSGADSVFNGVTYHSIGRFLFRQDGKKVYNLESDSQEVLLYDFGLEVGDTFKWSFRSDVVNEIYTTYIDTFEAKVFLFDNWYEQTWIEGIGNIHGKFDMPLRNLIDGGSELCRFYLNNKQVFIQRGVCWPLGLEDNNSNVKLHLSISPNPTTGEVNITFSQQAKSFELIDIYGRVVKTYTVTNNEMKMDWQWLPSGMYVIRDNIQNTSRFIKVD